MNAQPDPSLQYDASVVHVVAARRGSRADFFPAAGSPSLRRGSVVGRKYEILHGLGASELSIVVAARRIGAEQQVALKLLRPEFAGHQPAMQRFGREVALAQSLQGARLPRVLEVGSASDGTPFVVLEPLVGDDVRSLLRARKRLSVPAAIDWVLQLCEALAAMHAAQHVHLDVKLENLLLARPGVRGRGRGNEESLLLLDFALGGIDTDHAHESAAVSGGPSCIRHLAPELIRSDERVDARADIWSVGCVLYELLSGRPAFDAPNDIDACAAILQAQPEPLRSHVRNAPASLEDVLARCLEKSAAQRFANIAELAAALSPHAPARSAGYVERCHELLGVPVPVDGRESVAVECA